MIFQHRESRDFPYRYKNLFLHRNFISNTGKIVLKFYECTRIVVGCCYNLFKLVNWEIERGYIIVLRDFLTLYLSVAVVDKCYFSTEKKFREKNWRTQGNHRNTQGNLS